MIEEFEAFYEDGILRLNRKRFDDCWYIELSSLRWKLFEIDNEGEPKFVDKFPLFEFAYERGLKLNEVKK